MKLKYVLRALARRRAGQRVFLMYSNVEGWVVL